MFRIIIREYKYGIEFRIILDDREFWASNMTNAFALLDKLSEMGLISNVEWDIAYNALEKVA